VLAKSPKGKRAALKAYHDNMICCVSKMSACSKENKIFPKACKRSNLKKMTIWSKNNGIFFAARGNADVVNEIFTMCNYYASFLVLKSKHALGNGQNEDWCALKTLRIEKKSDVQAGRKSRPSKNWRIQCDE
tara:strand:- start:1301 stop:1696 length:396 start_codon:yes stop_codon:yes gene_type:complete